MNWNVSLPTSNKLIVADTGPLIALVRLGFLDLLVTLFQQVLITPIVLKECETKPDCAAGETIWQAVAVGHLMLSREDQALPAWGIDPDETGAAVLMDDKAGRTVVKHLGIKVISCAGVLALAIRRGKRVFVCPRKNLTTQSVL